MRLSVMRWLSLLPCLLLASVTHAHVVADNTVGFMHALQHSLPALGYLCVMLALWIWSSQMGGRFVRFAGAGVALFGLYLAVA